MKDYKKAYEIIVNRQLYLSGGIVLNAEKLILELVDKEIEFQSRKDKLVVGSEWVCVVEHHVEYLHDGDFYIIEVGQFISVTNLTDNIVAFQTDFLNLKCVDTLTHFLLCFKPKGENR